MEKKIDWKLLLTLIVAASPVLGYGLAYVYQLGYCSVFNIPTELIKLDLTTVLVAIAGTFGVLFLFAWFFLMFWITPRNISSIGQKIYVSLLLLIFLFVFSLLFLTLVEAEQIAIMYGAFLLIIFFGPWFARKLTSIHLGKRKSEPETPIDGRIGQIVNSKYFRYTIFGVCLLVIIIYCSALAGRSAAFNKQIFYVPSSNPDSVVLKIYGDNIICGQLEHDPGKDGLGPTIFVLPLNNNLNLSLTPIRIKISFTTVPK